MTTDENVEYKLGNVYNNLLNAGSVVALAISGSRTFVGNYTGTTSGSVYEEAVEDLACLKCISTHTGGTSAGFSYVLGRLNVNKSSTQEFSQMANMFSESVKQWLVILGKTVRYDKVND